MSLKGTNKAADLIVNKLQYRAFNHFSSKTQGIVVDSKIKDARNCGYIRMEELRCAVFHVLSSIDESRRESYQELNIRPKHSCGKAIRKTVRTPI